MKKLEMEYESFICIIIFHLILCIRFSRVSYVKFTFREKAPSNKTLALRKSTNMGVWAVGTLARSLPKGFQKQALLCI